MANPDANDGNVGDPNSGVVPTPENEPETVRSLKGVSPDMTPTPVSTYVTVEQAIKAEGSPVSTSPRLPGRRAIGKISGKIKLAAGTVLVTAALVTSMVDRNKPKTPRPSPVIVRNATPGGSEDGNNPNEDAGSSPPDPDIDDAAVNPDEVDDLDSSEETPIDLPDTAVTIGAPTDAGAATYEDAAPDSSETQKCRPDITADGRPVQEGTCVIVFALGEDTVYKARLEKARIMIDSKNYEVEVDYGAVRGIAGNRHPDFMVRGSKHFLKADMAIQGTIWVENTQNGKVATVKSEEGVTLLQTTWTDDMVLKPGEFKSFSLEAPEGGEAPKCSMRWAGEQPDKDAEAWLSMLGALSVLGIARRKKRAN